VEEQVRPALAQSSPDPAQLSPLIVQANDIDEWLALSTEQNFRMLQQMLTIPQKARLMFLRPELQRQVRQAIRITKHRIGQQKSSGRRLNHTLQTP
jgi:hypothetical protein